jgi:ribosomal protein S18 acetylase RimI-like enzyme
VVRWMLDTPLWQRYEVTAESSTARFETRFLNGELLLAADGDEPACGFIWVIPNGGFGRWPYVRLIGVKGSQQRKGIGEALIRDVETRFDSTDLFLLVSDFNERAQQFYKRLGFEEVGAIPDLGLPDITELILRKKLR